MRIAGLGLLLFLTAVFTPPPPPFFGYADRAGNRIDPLAGSGDPAEIAPENRVSITYAQDNHCALLRRDGGQWRLHLFDTRPAMDAVAAPGATRALTSCKERAVKVSRMNLLTSMLALAATTAAAAPVAPSRVRHPPRR